MEGALCRGLLRLSSRRVVAISPGFRAPLLGSRAFAAEATCDNEDHWKVSAKFGKSTVTQELWQRRESDKQGTAGSHIVSYPFSTSLHLRDEYVGNTGKVLVGKLLEDLDALAGNVSFDWCSETLDSNGDAPALVTAAVDKITLDRPLPITEDVHLSGRVIWTGTSSLLVRMTMRAGSRPGEGDHLMDADFVYVALDRATKKTAKVPQLVPETPEDKDLFELGARQAAQQKERRNKTVLPYELQDPRVAMAMVNAGDTLVELPQVRKASPKVLMDHTGLETTVLTKPQDQNTAGNVFGGMLMRECYELAFTTCFGFLGRHPTFKEIMEFIFEKPVPVGSLLRLRSRVVYTVGQDACVEVQCIVVQPDKDRTFRANSIIVVFNTGGDVGEIIPHSLMEAKAQLWAKQEYEASYGVQTSS